VKERVAVALSANRETALPRGTASVDASLLQLIIAGEL
jgi:hypothetical protein